MSHITLSFHFENTKKALRVAIKIALQSMSVSLPIIRSTASMTATAATFTESKKYRNTLDPCNLGSMGLSIITKIKDGRKIPAVAAIAPQNPESWYPMKVEVDNTGPGVNWPTAMASINSVRVSQPRVTSSASR